MGWFIVSSLLGQVYQVLVLVWWIGFGWSVLLVRIAVRVLGSGLPTMVLPWFAGFNRLFLSIYGLLYHVA